MIGDGHIGISTCVGLSFVMAGLVPAIHVFP